MRLTNERIKRIAENSPSIIHGCLNNISLSRDQVNPYNWEDKLAGIEDLLNALALNRQLEILNLTLAMSSAQLKKLAKTIATHPKLISLVINTTINSLDLTHLVYVFACKSLAKLEMNGDRSDKKAQFKLSYDFVEQVQKHLTELTFGHVKLSGFSPNKKNNVSGNVTQIRSINFDSIVFLKDAMPLVFKLIQSPSLERFSLASCKFDSKSTALKDIFFNLSPSIKIVSLYLEICEEKTWEALANLMEYNGLTRLKIITYWDSFANAGFDFFCKKLSNYAMLEELTIIDRSSYASVWQIKILNSLNKSHKLNKLFLENLYHIEKDNWGCQLYAKTLELLPAFIASHPELVEISFFDKKDEVVDGFHVDEVKDAEKLFGALAESVLQHKNLKKLALRLFQGASFEYERLQDVLIKKNVQENIAIAHSSLGNYSFIDPQAQIFFSGSKNLPAARNANQVKWANLCWQTVKDAVELCKMKKFNSIEEMQDFLAFRRREIAEQLTGDGEKFGVRRKFIKELGPLATQISPQDAYKEFFQPLSLYFKEKELRNYSVCYKDTFYSSVSFSSPVLISIYHTEPQAIEVAFANANKFFLSILAFSPPQNEEELKKYCHLLGLCLFHLFHACAYYRGSASCGELQFYTFISLKGLPLPKYRHTVLMDLVALFSKTPEEFAQQLYGFFDWVPCLEHTAKQVQKNISHSHAFFQPLQLQPVAFTSLPEETKGIIPNLPPP